MNMQKKMASMSTVAALAIGMLSSVPASAQTAECESVDLLFNRFFPPHIAFVWAGMEPWAEDVLRVTEGRVRVSFPPSSLAPAPQQWNLILDSVADVAIVINPIESKRLHLPNIAGLPFVGDSSTARGVALWRTHEKFFADAKPLTTASSKESSWMAARSWTTASSTENSWTTASATKSSRMLARLWTMASSTESGWRQNRG